MLLSSLIFAAQLAAAPATPADLAALASRLPESGVVHLGLYNDGQRDGEMRLSWEARDQELVVRDRTAMPSAKVEETMTVSASAHDLAFRSAQISFHQGDATFEVDVQFDGEQISGSRTLTGPQGEQVREVDQAAASTTVPRALAFVLPLVLAGEDTRFTWYAPLADQLADVSISASPGGTVTTPAGDFETMRYEIRGGTPDNDVYVSVPAPGTLPRIVRIDVLGQSMRFLALPGDGG